MTDILVGSIIKAADLPATVFSGDDTDISNINTTSFTTGSPEVAVTFVAPTSGQVLITVGGGLRNNSGADQAFLSVEIRNNNGSGSVVRNPTVSGEDTLSCADESVSAEFKSRAYLHSGLTPGNTYYARVQYRSTSGNGTADVLARSVLVQPVP